VTAQTILTESYPVAKEEWVRLFMVWSGFVLLFDQLGGYIVDHFSGRSFYINIPIGIVATLQHFL
jgi:hypothetical protein